MTNWQSTVTCCLRLLDDVRNGSRKRLMQVTKCDILKKRGWLFLFLVVFSYLFSSSPLSDMAIHLFFGVFLSTFPPFCLSLPFPSFLSSSFDLSWGTSLRSKTTTRGVYLWKCKWRLEWNKNGERRDVRWWESESRGEAPGRCSPTRRSLPEAARPCVSGTTGNEAWVSQNNKDRERGELVSWGSEREGNMQSVDCRETKRDKKGARMR